MFSGPHAPLAFSKPLFFKAVSPACQTVLLPTFRPSSSLGLTSPHEGPVLTGSGRIDLVNSVDLSSANCGQSAFSSTQGWIFPYSLMCFPLSLSFWSQSPTSPTGICSGLQRPGESLLICPPPCAPARSESAQDDSLLLMKRGNFDAEGRKSMLILYCACSQRHNQICCYYTLTPPLLTGCQSVPSLHAPGYGVCTWNLKTVAHDG